MDKYTCTDLIFFHAGRHIDNINKDRHKNEKFNDVKCDYSQGMQKNDQEMTRFLKNFIAGF